jgi:PAS domain S-box-containing protein
MKSVFLKLRSKNRNAGSEELLPLKKRLERERKIREEAEAIAEKAIRDLYEKNEELKKRERRLKEAEHIARLGNWEWNLVTGKMTWSDELYRIAGVSPDEFAPTFENFMGLVHPDDREEARKKIEDSIQERRPYSFDHRILRRDGTVLTLHSRGEPVLDAGGELVKMRGTGQDITEPKRLEDELRRKKEELERSYREMEQFSYVASHDLQEPVRKIIAFGDRLRNYLVPEKNDEGEDYLKRMQGAARRMKELIDSLLEFSTLAKQKKSFQPVNLEEVLGDVVADLETRLEECGGRVEMEKLPVVYGDALQMRRLFQNLISNSLKFRRKETPPVIKLGSRSLDGDRVEVTVEDNGIGFDEKYLGQVFEPFRRLHTREEFEGVGMGLAICQKIVQWHGGEITARSRPGEGSIFVIRLPRPAAT